MSGSLSVLNVGSGDTVFSFDNSNPAETIRAARIVKDMLRRGYALLVEVERDGEKKYERAIDFDEKNCRYIIADFDPVVATKIDEQDAIDDDFRRATDKQRQEERQRGQSEQTETAQPAASTGETRQEGTEASASTELPKPGKRGKYKKSIDATSTRAVAVGRSAGG